MNKLPKWKQFLISWLAGDEPVILNFVIMGKNVPEGMSVISIPFKDQRKHISEYEDAAFLVPKINVSNA